MPDSDASANAYEDGFLSEEDLSDSLSPSPPAMMMMSDCSCSSYPGAAAAWGVVRNRTDGATIVSGFNLDVVSRSDVGKTAVTVSSPFFKYAISVSPLLPVFATAKKISSNSIEVRTYSVDGKTPVDSDYTFFLFVSQ